jgi:hypothetical protein
VVEYEGGAQERVGADVRALAAFADGRGVEEVPRGGVDSERSRVKRER